MRHVTKTVVITGGTGGLGTALARRLIAKDYRLAVTYLLPDEAQTFETEFEVDEERVMLTRVDCTNAEAVNSYIKEVADRWGEMPLSLEAGRVDAMSRRLTSF